MAKLNEQCRWWRVVATTEYGQAPRWSVMYLTPPPGEDGGPIEALRELFPSGEADEMNFVLFSTSGISGSYVTIEEVEASLLKYGPERIDEDADEVPDDWRYPEVTFVVVQPRILGMRYGNVRVMLEDIPWLKLLRETSWNACAAIGRDWP